MTEEVVCESRLPAHYRAGAGALALERRGCCGSFAAGGVERKRDRGGLGLRCLSGGVRGERALCPAADRSRTAGDDPSLVHGSSLAVVRSVPATGERCMERVGIAISGRSGSGGYL